MLALAPGMACWCRDSAGAAALGILLEHPVGLEGVAGRQGLQEVLGSLRGLS